MFSCLQILEAFLWFVLITLLNVTLIILTLSVSRLLNLLLRLVAFLLFLNPQCLASISRWITASSSWKRFCLFFFQAEDGIRDVAVTGVQTCALPISPTPIPSGATFPGGSTGIGVVGVREGETTANFVCGSAGKTPLPRLKMLNALAGTAGKIGRASCRERV